MSISFNNITTSQRTPGVFTEVDNSRALQGLFANPHKALILGQMVSDGNAAKDTIYQITTENVADGYFGAGSILSRMCRQFKENNPNTELHAIALSDNAAGTTASAVIHFSVALSHNAGVASLGDQTIHLLVNGSKYDQVLTSGWSVADVNSAFKTLIELNSHAPVNASTNATSALVLSAINNGECGNYIDVRFNYYTGQSYPTCFADSAVISAMEGGANNPDIGDAWAVIDNEQYHYIIQPYIDATNLTSLEDELEDRFKPLVDLQGHGFTGLRAVAASATTFGNNRNSPHNTVMAANDSPTAPEEWAAALGAIAAANLNNDPARPLHYLKLKNVLAPPVASRWTRSERDILLYDGIATFVIDSSGNVQIERCITTYQSNSLGITDASYLDIQTLFTIMEIRYQFKARMSTRYIEPRFKLADDTFPVQPGSYVVTPKTIKQEIISLFTTLRDSGLIENIDEFIDNLVVERNSTDQNRVDVLLPPDLINQFRILAGKVQFIL